MSKAPSIDPSPKPWYKALAAKFSRKNLPKKVELLQTIRNIREGREIESDVTSIMEGALHVSEMTVREVMIPKAKMVTLSADEQPKDFLPRIIDSGHSRFLVFDHNAETVLGILCAKDLLPLLLQPDGGDTRIHLRDHLREASLVPESKRLNTLLTDFRTNRNHMAIVTDEYGSVAGLITIEDILEQIVGNIEDEHDLDEPSGIRQQTSNEWAIEANTPIEDFNAAFNTQIPDEDFDTIGGVLLQQFGRIPERGETYRYNGFLFTVLRADGRRLKLLKAQRIR